MFGTDNEYLLNTDEPDDLSVQVCPGWNALEWIGHLRGKAKLCGPVNHNIAIDLRRQADVLERRLKRMESHAQHRPQ